MLFIIRNKPIRNENTIKRKSSLLLIFIVFLIFIATYNHKEEDKYNAILLHSGIYFFGFHIFSHFLRLCRCQYFINQKINSDNGGSVVKPCVLSFLELIFSHIIQDIFAFFALYGKDRIHLYHDQQT